MPMNQLASSSKPLYIFQRNLVLGIYSEKLLGSFILVYSGTL
jgi:hypothetical protein